MPEESPGLTTLVPEAVLRPRSAVTNAPHLVFVAPGGHCFLQNDTNRVMEQHRGEVPFAPTVIEGWRAALRGRQAALEAAGACYLFLLALLAGLRWVDPVPALQAERGGRQLYPLTDTHWDSEGA